MLPPTASAWRFDPETDRIETFANPLPGVVQLPTLIRASAAERLSALLRDGASEIAALDSAAASLAARTRDLMPAAVERERAAILPTLQASAAKIRAHVVKAAEGAAEARATLDSAANDDTPADLAADAIRAREARERYSALDSSGRVRVLEGSIQRGDRSLLRWLSGDPLRETISDKEAGEARARLAAAIRPDLVSLVAIREETAQLVAGAALQIGRAAGAALLKHGVPAGSVSHYAFAEAPASGAPLTSSH